MQEKNFLGKDGLNAVLTKVNEHTQELKTVEETVNSISIDWNNNNSDSINHINHRTHYNSTEILSSTLDLSSISEEDLPFTVTFLNILNATPSYSLTVTTKLIKSFPDTWIDDSSIEQVGYETIGTIQYYNELEYFDAYLIQLSSDKHLVLRCCDEEYKLDGIAVTVNLHKKLSASFLPVDDETISVKNGELVANIPEQLQSDWNQTDSSAVDYIKNKPFYEYAEVDENNVFLEHNFSWYWTGDPMSYDGEMHIESAYIDYTLVPNQSYGIKFSSSLYTQPEEMMVANNNGELYCSTSTWMLQITGNEVRWTPSESYHDGSVKVTITGPKRYIKQLDVKYIPTEEIPTENSTKLATSGMAYTLNSNSLDRYNELKSEKLSKRPNSIDLLIDDNNKINTAYISDVLLGQLKFGGVLVSVTMNNSDTLVSLTPTNSFIADCNIPSGSSIDVTYLSTGTDAKYCIDYVDDLEATNDFKHIPEGYFFINNADFSMHSSDPEWQVGDWAVVIDGKWSKVDNTDAVMSVNGKIGSVTLDSRDILYVSEHDDDVSVYDKIESKVDKVTGKSLSTNDYTTAEKNKLASIESGAQKNVTYTLSKTGTSINLVDNTGKVVSSVTDTQLSAATLTTGASGTQIADLYITDKLTIGYNNTHSGTGVASQPGSHSVVVGTNNVANSGTSGDFAVFGDSNLLELTGDSGGINQAFIIGHSNEINNSGESFVSGKFNMSSHWLGHIGGINNYNTRGCQTVFGYAANPSTNSLFTIGNGDTKNNSNFTSKGTFSSEGRSNAFEVFADGRAAVGKDPENAMDVVTKQYLESKIAELTTKIEQLEARLQNT